MKKRGIVKMHNLFDEKSLSYKLERLGTENKKLYR
jgi:hypothetical protein